MDTDGNVYYVLSEVDNLVLTVWKWECEDTASDVLTRENSPQEVTIIYNTLDNEWDMWDTISRNEYNSPRESFEDAFVAFVAFCLIMAIV